MPDFNDLLAKPTDDIKKPEPLPVGSYLGSIVKYEFAEAKTPKDKENPVKAVAEMSILLNEALDDVDPEDLAMFLASGAKISGRKYSHTFWLTADALYRVVEFAASLGIETSGKTLGEIFPELLNQSVIAAVDHVQSKKPGKEDDVYANITNLAAIEA